MLARGVLGSGRTRSVFFQPFPNSSGWWWLISSVFLIRISCHKTTHANGYYGTWPGWAVSISVLPLTHGLQHARLPCSSPSPGACSNSCPLSRWCQPSRSLLSPSPPAFNLSQHQGLFQWVSSLHQVAKVLELQLQHQSFQWTFRTDFL